MMIGQIIRKYRKVKGLTQQEMAQRLGVSTPAVNKWENGYAYPDITLLAPIARCLEIDLDTLLSFEIELSREEIIRLVNELHQILKDQGFDEGFSFAKLQMQRYPNCDELLWQMTVILEAKAMEMKLDLIDDDICAWYLRVAKSKDETLRYRSAQSLFNFYLRKEQYEQAEECCSYFSKENPMRKLNLAGIYRRTHRNEEAYRTYEECLFSMVQVLNLNLQGLYELAMQNQDLDKASLIVDKLAGLAELFEMGAFSEVAPRLEWAVFLKDKEEVIAIMQKLLSDTRGLYGFVNSPLYSHMIFKPIDEVFLKELKENLRESFTDEETYGFLKDNQRWLDLIRKENM